MPPTAEPARAPPDEAGLVDAAQAGDRTAYGLIVRMHQVAVRRQLRQLCKGDDALADDLAQQAFVRAWQALPAFRGEARLSTWLHAIAYREFLMQRRSTRDEAASERAADADVARAEDTIADPALPVERHAAMRLDVARALAALSEPERLAIVHCTQLELTHEEAAEVLGMPLGTLKSHVARGKARLRAALAAWQPREETA